MGFVYSMCRDLNIWSVLDESDGAVCIRRIVTGRRIAGAIRSLVNARDLQIFSLSVLESCIRHCLYLFFCMAVRQCYGRRIRDLY